MAESEREVYARLCVARFADAILHGDDEHRAWLLEAAEAFNEGRPLPPPRGKGTSQPATDKISEFRLHQRVVHVSLGEGEVTGIDGSKMTVMFDRLTSKGRAVVGIYDNNWFRICPNTLVAKQ